MVPNFGRRRQLPPAIFIGSYLSYDGCCRASRLKHRLGCAARGGLRLRPLHVKEV
jgi:hypothetical protein